MAIKISNNTVIDNSQNWTGSTIPVSKGGTGANSAAGARINLGLDIFVTGMIMMWSGTIATIPSGWALCDGTSGTPDLRNRFIIGANTDTTGQSTTSITGTATKTGGSKDAIVVEHTHSITDPGHIHTYQNRGTAAETQSGTSTRPRNLVNQNTGTSTTGITIDSTGSSGTNANLPPYYALAFIMKL